MEENIIRDVPCTSCSAMITLLPSQPQSRCSTCGAVAINPLCKTEATTKSSAKSPHLDRSPPITGSSVVGAYSQKTDYTKCSIKELLEIQQEVKTALTNKKEEMIANLSLLEDI